jgi:PGF-CTERM protein
VKKKDMRIKNIVGIFAIMLMVSIFVMPASAQNSGIPIKLELTAEPSTIIVGETAIITIRLLDENDKPVVTEVDISVSVSTNLGSVPSPLIIPAKKDLAETQFTSEVYGIAVISAKSRGLISDTTSIAVIEEKFRVEPTVALTPIVNIIEKGQNGIVELYINNPSPNDVALHMEMNVIVPAGIHVYSEQHVWATTAGGAYSSLFEVPPGTERTISLHVIADETARIGQHTLNFGGLYYPGNNKDLCNQISLTYPVIVIEPSMEVLISGEEVSTTGEEVSTTGEAVSTTGEAVPGFEAVFTIAGLLAVAYLLRRRK